jgi:hypothetical protein
LQTIPIRTNFQRFVEFEVLEVPGSDVPDLIVHIRHNQERVYSSPPGMFIKAETRARIQAVMDAEKAKPTPPPLVELNHPRSMDAIAAQLSADLGDVENALKLEPCQCDCDGESDCDCDCHRSDDYDDDSDDDSDSDDGDGHDEEKDRRNVVPDSTTG